MGAGGDAIGTGTDWHGAGIGAGPVTDWRGGIDWCGAGIGAGCEMTGTGTD